MQLLDIDITLDRWLGAHGSGDDVLSRVIFGLLLCQLALLHHELHDRVVDGQKLHAVWCKKIRPAVSDVDNDGSVLQNQCRNERRAHAGKIVTQLRLLIDCLISKLQRPAQNLRRAFWSQS